MSHSAYLAMLALGLLIASPPLTDYRTLNLYGWEARVERKLIDNNPKLWRSVEEELRNQLYRIVRVMPAEPLGKIQKVIIWIHETSPETKCMAYHPGAQWLRDHKMNPEMEEDIEIGNAAAFVSWTYQQPWMVLHELAHAYHHRFLEKGFEHPDVLAVFKKAMDAKLYEKVVHWNGGDTKHYATSNQMEYFAETSEAYFGQNDFYPFVRAELKRHDPDGDALMVRVWGEPKR